MRKTKKQLRQERDQDFTSRFCSSPTYIGKGGDHIRVCRQIDATEVLDFMHQWDAIQDEEENK